MPAARLRLAGRRRTEQKVNSLSLALEARTTAADISQISLSHFLTKKQIDHRASIKQHKMDPFSRLLARTQLERIHTHTRLSMHIHYVGHMYTKETIIIHVI